MRVNIHLIGHLIGIAAALLVPAAETARAGETVMLRTGFQLHADRHEIEGEKVRLYSSGGMMEIRLASVQGFEADMEVTIPEAATPAPAPMVPVAPVPVIAPKPQTPVDLANSAAEKFKLPASFVRSVMKAESGFQPAALSPKGAIGLMQLMPGTAQVLGVDPKDPKQNADGGAQYLRELLAKYENNPDQVLLALAAYNAGPGAVEKYHGVPPYRETREYILRVLKNWERQEENDRKATNRAF